MQYNRPHAQARWGTWGTDMESRVDFPRMREERFAKAQKAIRDRGLGAVLAMTFDNVRYITGTHFSEAVRDKLGGRYAIAPREGKPFLFDPAVPAKRLHCPFMEDRMEPAIGSMLGALPPQMKVNDSFAKQIKRVLTEYGVEKEPIGIDLCDIPLLDALRAEGLAIVDGQQAMLDAREVKTADEIELLKQAASMIDATYEQIARAIRPGVKEQDLVAIAAYNSYKLGSERVESHQCISGWRGRPHCHTTSDRIIQPGDMVFLDLMHSYMGYHTCYYRTFICGKPTKAQERAYETASKWLSDSLDKIKPGATTADVCDAWPKAEEYGYQDEDAAFLLQFGHGIGLSLWERPILSRRFSYTMPAEIKEGMVFAVETWKGSDDGNGASRIEEELVVTKDGCEIITCYPSDHLISCGLPGCEVYV